MRCFSVSRNLRAATNCGAGVGRMRWILFPLVTTLAMLCLFKVSHTYRGKAVAETAGQGKAAAERARIGGLHILYYECNGKLDNNDEPDELTRPQNGSQSDMNSQKRLPSVCLNEKCRAAHVRHFQREKTHPIPKIRHIIWRNESVSKYFAVHMQSWQKIHPDWTYVLWRDQDMEPHVATHFPDFLDRFNSLPAHIMRVDMFRYMVLFLYGGVYADLDYSLVRSLDTHRRFHAVVTREPEAHSLLFRSMTWPVKPLTNPAFLMSAPGHPFFLYVIQQLLNSKAKGVLDFAGPFGLTCILENYMRLLPIATHAAFTVYLPPSRSFYPYQGNRINSSLSNTVEYRLGVLALRCQNLMSSNKLEMRRAKRNPHFKKFCRDVNNLDAITDTSEPVIAIHDLQKAGGIWYGKDGHNLYTEDLIDIRQVLRNVKFGIDFTRKVHAKF